jgi:hypothetical protein
MTIDMLSTLSSLMIVRTDGEDTPDPTVAFSIKVAAGDVDACANGTSAIDAEVTGNTDFSSTDVSTDEATMSQSAVDIINSGAFSLCASATASVDVDLSLDEISMSMSVAGDCDEPEDHAGVWVGEYTCDDVCDGYSTTTPSTPIELTITQSGNAAIYTSDNSIYFGTVCGNTFSHWGVGSGYSEYGTFTRTGDTTATKTSTWTSTNEQNCGGTCSDTLELQSN